MAAIITITNKPAPNSARTVRTVSKLVFEPRHDPRPPRYSSTGHHWLQRLERHQTCSPSFAWATAANGQGISRIATLEGKPTISTNVYTG